MKYIATQLLRFCLHIIILYSCICISLLNKTFYNAPTYTLIGKFYTRTFHPAMCSLIYCWNVCYCIYQHRYSSALFIHFGWFSSKTVFFTSKLLLSVAQLALFLAAPGSAWLHLRRAVLTSVASVEEYDDWCLYHSDSAWFAPRLSAEPWNLALRLMFILRICCTVCTPSSQHYYRKLNFRQGKNVNCH